VRSRRIERKPSFGRHPPATFSLKKKISLSVLALLLFATAPAAAQGPRETRGGPAGAFDFYVLALSWSPGFCELEGERRGLEQCEPGRGLGFVVHGLWPQFERGYPTECGPAGRSPSRLAMEEAADVFPSQGLARHEWRKHGACSGKSPAEYFRDVRRARERVRVPDALAQPTDDLRMTPLALERAFADANPGLRPDMMSVSCRRGVLQEVRICLDRALDGFRTCPQVDHSGCRTGEITIRAAR
jgi:ribonuclease T2